MKNKGLKKLCIAYLIVTMIAYCIILFLFAILSSLPAVLNIVVALTCIVPTAIMLIFVLVHSRAYLFIKSIIHYMFIFQITLIAFFANGLESTSLLFFFAIPFIAHSLEENIIIPSILIIIIFSFFTYCHFCPNLSSSLSKISSLPDNIRFNNLNSGYIILYYFVFSVPFIQSFYYVKMQSSYNRTIDEKNRELKREKQFKENLLINAAHEIKTPHTIIINSLEELSQSYPQLQSDPRFLAIKGEIKRVIKEAADIFDEEKLNICDNIYNHDKLFSLSSFLREKCLLFSSYAAVNEIKVITRDIENNLYIKAADEAIDKVLNNLLDNAIKYTSAGGKVEIIAKGKGAKIELVIKDNGIGIPEEDKENLFKRYYQATKKKEYSRGIGLGLYLVKKILDTLKAGIEIKSNENEGTAVHIELERYFVEADETIDGYSISSPAVIADLFSEPGESSYDESRQTILVVEDEPAIVEIFKNKLEGLYNVVTASNGKAALQRLKKRKVNLIISDVMMPLMNGLDLCKELKSLDEYKNIPFIFITAKTRDAERIKGLKSGANDYINKPFNSNELYLKIKNNMKLHEQLIETTQSGLINEFENNYKEKIAQLPPRLKQITDLLYHRPSITNREIAETLDIKLGSVGSYIKDISAKFDLQSERKSEVIDFIRKYRNS